jgi:hypothetical protein
MILLNIWISPKILQLKIRVEIMSIRQQSAGLVVDFISGYLKKIAQGTRLLDT